MDLDNLWQAVLGELEVSLSKANFSTWFKDTFISALDEGAGIVVIGVPDSFHKEWLENKFNSQVLKTLLRLDSRIKKINYKVISKTNPVPLKSVSPSLSGLEKTARVNLNPHYVFDAFIVGASNRLAHAAAKAVAKKRGETYNPLFIYGGVGLGKTHLMQAIGNEVLAKEGDARIVYATCEKFTNEFVRGVQTGRINAFKERYRSADMLLIDDIQFLAGKESTKEEFFHTFNTLYQDGRQIVISSDRPPQALSSLEDRLVSRFGGGMVADINPPDIETRIAILKQKRKEKGYACNDEILDFIAEKVPQNIRELEGALTRLIATCQLQSQEPTLELANQVLGSLWEKTIGPIDINKILQSIAEFYGLKENDLLDKKRDKEYVHPRQIAMYLLRHELGYSFPKIGKELKRDHTTIMHGCEKIKKEIIQKSGLKQEITLIKSRIYEK